MRRLGEENDDVAIIFLDSGAHVALFPLSMANLQFSTKTKLQDAQQNRTPTKRGAKFPCVSPYFAIQG